MYLSAPAKLFVGTPKIWPEEYMQYIKKKFRNKPEVCASFWRIMDEHTQDRINIPDILMSVSELFKGYPELIAGFCTYLPSKQFIEDYVEAERMETEVPVQNAKIEDGSAKPVSEFAATSSASASYSSSYSHSTHSSCASGSSSHSSPENASEPHRAQEEKAGLREGTVYVTDMKSKIVDTADAYCYFIVLVSEINTRRDRIHDIMEQARDVLQGYPELIEGFNRYLPAGFRIEVLPNDHGMSTD